MFLKHQNWVFPLVAKAAFLGYLIPFTTFPGCFQKDGYTYSTCLWENDSCSSTLQCLPDLASVCFSSGWGSLNLPGLIWERAACSSPSTNWLTLGEGISADMVFKYRPKRSGTNATPAIQGVKHCLFMGNTPFGGCRRLQPKQEVTGREQSSSPVIIPIDLIRAHRLCVKTLEKPTQFLSS